MHKVLKSYSKEAKQNHEVIRPTAGQQEQQQNGFTADAHSGQVVPAYDGKRGAWPAPFEERSSYQTHEQYKKKLKRSKPKTDLNAAEAAERLRRYQEAVNDYARRAQEWLNWVKKETLTRDKHQRESYDLGELRELLAEIERFKRDILPPKHHEKQDLAELYAEIQSVFAGIGPMEIDVELSTANLDMAWKALLKALELQEKDLRHRVEQQSAFDDLTSGLDRGIRETNGKLDLLGNRIGNTRSGIQSLSSAELKEILDGIVKDLHALEPPIDGFFKDVDQLKAAKHRKAEHYHGRVCNLDDRRADYLKDIDNLIVERSEWLRRLKQDQYQALRMDMFRNCEECIEWTEQRIRDLQTMEFAEDYPTLQQALEQHKLNNQVIVDFHQEVDKCIAAQSEISAEDAPIYAELLSTLESNYQQLRDLSTGRMLDLDSLMAFVQAAQQELDWITEHEEPEFMTKAKECEDLVEYKRANIEARYTRTDFSLEEGELFLKELEDIGSLLDEYLQMLMQLVDESSTVCPLWQRGEQIDRVLPVTAICEYPDKDIMLQKSDDCLLLDSSELMRWLIQGPDGTQGYVPSINLRIPPPDDRMLGYLQRLRGQFDKLRKIWIEKHRLIRYNMLMNTMRDTRAWDLEKFLSIEPDEREAIMKALTEDTHKLMSEMDPNDPLAFHLKDELELTKQHIYYLMQLAQKGPDDDLSAEYDRKLVLILPNLDKAWKRLNDCVAGRIPQNLEELEKLLADQKDFEDNLQGLDSEIAGLKEIFNMLKDPNPMQRARMEELLARWEDLWELSRLYVERLQSLEKLLNSLLDVSRIVRGHEDFLLGTRKMPADLEALRGYHSQLLELNMVLKQQQPIIDEMSLNAGQLRQHVARTRYNVADHPDVDEVDLHVQNLVDRWENIGTQVSDRLKTLETAIQDLIAYRSIYENEIPWLDNVESVIDTLRAPEELDPEEYESHLDLLLAQYDQLAEHTNAFENMNHDGGRFVREAKTYDMKLDQYKDMLKDIGLSSFEAGIPDASKITDIGRKITYLKDAQDTLNQFHGPNKLSDKDRVTRKLQELIRTLDKIENLDKGYREILQRNAQRDQIIDTLQRKFGELGILRGLIQDLHELYKAEHKYLASRMQNLQRARSAAPSGSEGRAKIDNDLRVVNDMLDILADTLRNLEELERDRQLEELDTRRKIDEARQKIPGQDDVPGAQQVSDELDDANRRFSQLSSVILEKRNEIMTLNQNWKRKMMEQDARDRAALEAARRAAEEAERLRRAQEDEANRLKNEVLESYQPIREAPLLPQSTPDMEYAPALCLQDLEDMNAFVRAADETDKLRAEIDNEMQRLSDLNPEINDLEQLKRAKVPYQEDQVRKEKKPKLETAPMEPQPIPIQEKPIEKPKSVNIVAAPHEPQPTPVEEIPIEKPKSVNIVAAPHEPQPTPVEEIPIEKPRIANIEAALEEPQATPIYQAPIEPEKRVEIELAPTEPVIVQHSKEQAESIPLDELNDFEEARDAEDVARMAEHEDEIEMFQEETVTKTKFYDLEAVKVIETGEILTFVDAIRQGLLDLHSGEGEFYDIVSGSRVSLEKAAELGYITQSFSDCLNTYHGIRDPESGQEVTLLQAIQLGIYDPDNRQLKDPSTGELLALYDSVRMGIISLSIVPSLVKTGILKLPPMQLRHALDRGVVNRETGVFTGLYTRESMALKDALRNGYITLNNEYPPLIAITLNDCINMRFVNPYTGEFKDRNSEDSFSLKDAVDRKSPMINLNVREVVNTRDLTRITLAEGIAQRVFNLKDNTFVDLQNQTHLNLQEAKDSDFIQKPMTLKEIERFDRIDSVGRLIDGGLKRRVTLLEAVADGLLDPDVKHIVDPEMNDIISISEALERGILKADGLIYHPEENTSFTIHRAVQNGFVVERAHHSIFDVKGVKDMKTGRALTFNEAMEEGIISLPSEQIFDMSTGRSVNIDTALERGIIDPTLHQMLTIDLGSQRTPTEPLTVFGAICKGLIEPQKKIFFDPNRKQEFTPRSAYEAGLISLRGAMWLSGLFDVHPSLVPTVKPAKLGTKRISKPGAPLKDQSFEQIKITLADAMRQGLVDARAQRFRQGDTEMSLQEALNQGLVNAEREWIVPDKAMAVGPTVQESVTEKLTETTQALAPKVYPDKNLEESVTTVKKLKTTETVAVGGPGGVSAYRAVTGGKGSLEVPADGFHLYEAERNGLIDLSTGIVTPPDTKRTMTLEEAFELGIINSKQIHVKDPKSGREMKPHEAISSGIMAATGHVVDPRTGRSHTLEAAIKHGLVIIEAEPPAMIQPSKKVIQFGAGPSSGPIISFAPVGEATYEESENIWTFDATTGQVIDEYTGEKLSLDDAIRSEKVSIDSIRVVDSLTGRKMSYEDAMKFGIIDRMRKYYVDKRDGRRYSLQEAAQQGFVFLTGDVPEHADDAVQTKMKQQTKKQVTTKTAHIAGPASFIDYDLSKVIDLGWYNAQDGMFAHPDTNKQMTLKESIIKGLFNPHDSFVIDNETGQRVSLLDAIQCELVDATEGTLKDKKTGRNIDLKTAYDKKLICSTTTAQSLNAIIKNGQLDHRTGMMKTLDGTQTFQLHDAIRQGLVDGTTIFIRNPTTGCEMRMPEAVQQNIVDLAHGLIKDRETNRKTDFLEALKSGIMYPASAVPPKFSVEGSKLTKTTPPSPLARVRHASLKVSQPAEVREQKYDTFSIHVPDENFSVQQRTMVPYEGAFAPSPPLGGGRKQEVVDLGGGKQVPVKVVRGKDGVDRGEYVDPSSGMKFTVQLHGDPYRSQTKTLVKSTSQVQSMELEPHAELVGVNKVKDLRNGRVMSLNEAQRLGLAKVDKKGKQMSKTYAVFRSDIGHALNNGIIHPATRDQLSFEDAIHCKLVDIQRMTYIHPASGEILDFTKAANMGLMDVTLAETLPRGVCNPANGERLTIEDAISMRIINPQSGQVFNPFTNERLTWLDIVKPIYTSLTTEGIYDPKKGYGVPLTSALNEGLIDPHKGMYCNPVTGESIPLPEATKNGLIDKDTLKLITDPCIKHWHSGQNLSLLEAVDAGIVDTRKRTVVLSKGLVMPIPKAVQEGQFPRDVGERLKRVDKWTFAEALGQGLIDVAYNQFTDPDSGKKMTIEQAFEHGFLDTGAIPGGPLDETDHP